MNSHPSFLDGRFERARSPLATTPPGWDLRLLFVGLPVLWVVGLEQVVPVLVLLLVAGRAVFSRTWVPRSRLLLLLTVFLVLQLAAVTMVTSPERLITFLRTFSTYLSAAGILIIVLNEARARRSMRPLLRAGTYGLLAASVLSLMAIFGIARFEFTSPFAALIPDWIRQTGYGRLVAERAIGGSTWFWGRSVYRTSTFFLYANTYATALAAFVPIALYLAWTTTKRHHRAGWILAVALLVVGLVSTTSRTSIAAVLVGAMLWAFLSMTVYWRSVAAVFVAMILVVVPFAFPASSAALVDATVGARGYGSASSRVAIYSGTLAGIAARPVLGWGTERDPPGVENPPYPYGSHSYYLGTAFRFGVPALLVFAWIIVRSWRSVSIMARTSRGPRRAGFRILYWSITTMMLTAVTTSHDLDLMTMLYLWLVLSVIEASRTEPSLLTSAS